MSDQKISPCLWFDHQLEEAAEFYVKVFPNSHVGDLSRQPDGSVLAGDFTINGTTFIGINGGPAHAGFTEAVSFSVSCADQAEIDYYWDALSEGGEPGPCGWVKDKFGLSWQVVPSRLPEFLGHPDPAKAQAAVAAMLGMSKFVIADLEAAIA